MRKQQAKFMLYSLLPNYIPTYLKWAIQSGDPLYYSASFLILFKHIVCIIITIMNTRVD